MEELYYVNCYKKAKDKGCTWRELLQWCHELIATYDQRDRYWYDRIPKADAYMPARINDFFSKWRHHYKDGHYWTEGKYERILIGIDENNQKIYENGDWIPPTLKFTEGGTFVTDSYGRIIPSGYIKDCYLKFKPAPIPKRKTWYPRYLGDYVFRRGPIIGGGGYRKWCGRRYKGDHGYLGNECRSSDGFKYDLRELNKEFNINIKFNRDRAKFVWGMYTDWDEPHWKNKGRGWKRTRKKKQWM